MLEFYRQAERLERMPPYVFSEINRMKSLQEKLGAEILSLAVGDPDQPTPPKIIEKLVEASQKPQNHGYSPYEGTLSFRSHVSRWLTRRFGVEADPESELIALIGSKEGIAHFPLAFCNPGDKVLYPSPGYPIFETCILLAGATPVAFPHVQTDSFCPDLNRLRELVRTHRPRLMILNYPSNPTTVALNLSVMKEIVELARHFGTWIAYDNAYSEIYFDETRRPPSILQIPGAKEIAIEFHSLSKTFNMTGWRLGFAVGNEKLIKGLLRVKTNIDSGPLLAVQEAGSFALSNSDFFSTPLRELYRQRQSILLEGLDRLEIEYLKPLATFFVWARVPQGILSMDFTRTLIEKHGLVVTPGIGFGPEGEGFFRLSLTVGSREIQEALKRLENFTRVNTR